MQKATHEMRKRHTCQAVTKSVIFLKFVAMELMVSHCEIKLFCWSFKRYHAYFKGPSIFLCVGFQNQWDPDRKKNWRCNRVRSTHNGDTVPETHETESLNWALGSVGKGVKAGTLLDRQKSFQKHKQTPLQRKLGIPIGIKGLPHSQTGTSSAQNNRSCLKAVMQANSLSQPCSFNPCSSYQW